MINFRNLPAEFKENSLFCLWKREQKNSRMTKMPYKTNGYRTKSIERADFTDFETAMKYAKNFNGIGLGVFEPYCAVDIDHCTRNGKLYELAIDIVNTFNSYTKFSPSGEGVRIIFKTKDVEYDKKRYSSVIISWDLKSTYQAAPTSM